MQIFPLQGADRAFMSAVKTAPIKIKTEHGRAGNVVIYTAVNLTGMSQ